MTDPWQPPEANPNAAPPFPSVDGIPWEREQNARTLFETLKMVLLDPTGTFERASPTISFGPSFVYMLILGVAGGLIGALWQWATVSQAAQFLQQIPEEYRPFVEAFTQPSLATLILVPIQLVIGVFVGAGVLHLCLLIVGGANGRFEDSLRAVAFAQGSVALLQIVPLMGPMIAGVWAIVIEIYAVKALHRTTGGKAALGVLLPVIALLVCCCCGAVMAAGSLGSYFGNQ